MDRRHFVAGSTAAAAALAVGPAFGDDAYPSHAITFINPFPPGGAADVVGRPLTAMLEPILKQPCIVETKAGAAGQVGGQQSQWPRTEQGQRNPLCHTGRRQRCGRGRGPHGCGQERIGRARDHLGQWSKCQPLQCRYRPAARRCFAEKRPGRRKAWRARFARILLSQPGGMLPPGCPHTQIRFTLSAEGPSVGSYGPITST